MNKYEQLYIYYKVCVYNGVYEGNIPVSMIHLYSRGSGLILGERPFRVYSKLCKQVFTKGLGLIPTWRPMVYFWEDLKKTFIFDLLFKVKKQIRLIEICTKRCVYNEIPNFMYRNGTYTYVEAHVLFYKTWLIVLFTDASFRCFESFILKEVFCTKKKKRDLYSLMFERPMVLKIN